MKLSILAYSTTKDTIAGKRFINTTHYYTQLPENCSTLKTLARNISCRVSHLLTAVVATTSLLVNFIFATILRTTNLISNYLEPLSKKLYTQTAANTIILGLSLKGSFLGPQFVTRIPTDIDQTEQIFIQRKIKRFKDEFHDVPQNHEHSTAIVHIQNTIQNLWAVTAQEQVGSLEFTLSRYDHLNEFIKRYTTLFEITKTFRDRLIFRPF